MSIRLFFSSIIFLFSSAVIAAEETKVVMTPTSPLSTGALFETLFALLVVLGCIVLVAWLLRRTNQFHTSANGQLKIVAGLALGARERIVIIQAGNEQILVGITPQQIQTLHVLNKPIEHNTSQSSSGSFAEKLNKVLQDKKNTK